MPSTTKYKLSSIETISLISYFKPEGRGCVIMAILCLLLKRKKELILENLKLRQTIKSARSRTESYYYLQGTIRQIYYGVPKPKE